ncbi:MAG: hypothetical protein L3J41_05765 [Melioribacteraceae bacterium]|nr:hypothetical protein [Melioribacteraceae bacterium]
MKDYEFKISQFVDNELSESEQKELFLFLAENEAGREVLSDFIEIKKEIKSFYSGMNNTKVVTIGKATQNKKERKQKAMFYFSTAAAILFGFLFLFNQFKENPFLIKYQNLQTEMIELQENYSDVLKRQTDLIKINHQLYIGTQQLKTSKVAKQNGRDNKSTILQSAINKNGKNYSPVNQGRMLASLQNIQIIEITKNDFLGGQIIGN